MLAISMPVLILVYVLTVYMLGRRRLNNQAVRSLLLAQSLMEFHNVFVSYVNSNATEQSSYSKMMELSSIASEGIRHAKYTFSLPGRRGGTTTLIPGSFHDLQDYLQDRVLHDEGIKIGMMIENTVRHGESVQMGRYADITMKLSSPLSVIKIGFLEVSRIISTMLYSFGLLKSASPGRGSRLIAFATFITPLCLTTLVGWDAISKNAPRLYRYIGSFVNDNPSQIAPGSDNVRRKAP